MRRLIAFAGVVGLACASLAAPPGGPQRKTPPEILKVTPESGAVNVTDRSVVFEFDAIVSDRAGRSGDLSGLVLLSPHDDGTSVRWRRNRIEVRPRRGFLPGTAYSVTLLPGVLDLNGNAMRTTRTVAFSTGPTIPPFAIHGRVFDWIAERIAPNALVEIIRHPDSLPYVGVSDSTGQFAIGPLEDGSYSVRAVMDNNHNRALDANEPWDSLSIVVQGVSPFVELLAAPRDTAGPRLLTVTPADSMTLDASFDRLLDPGLLASFRVVGADSARLVIARVLTLAQHQALRASRDSNAKRDSTASDSLSRRIPGTVSPPKPSRPAPTKDVVILMDSLTPLRPGASYRVTAVNTRGLLGIVRTSERVITMPRAPADSARAPGARKP